MGVIRGDGAVALRRSPARVARHHPARGHHPFMAAPKYEFRIRGRLSETVLARFDPLVSDVERVETVLHGRIRDQAELHGIIERVQALGLELLEIRRLPD
jgi:hypothetical protein